MKIEKVKVLDTELRENGWWYPMPVLQKILMKIEASNINERFGELGFPQKHTVDLEKVAFTYENPQLVDNELFVDIILLDTDKGEELKTIKDQVRFVVVGFGELENGVKMKETYEFVSIAAIPPKGYESPRPKVKKLKIETKPVKIPIGDIDEDYTKLKTNQR